MRVRPSPLDPVPIAALLAAMLSLALPATLRAATPTAADGEWRPLALPPPTVRPNVVLDTGRRELLRFDADPRAVFALPLAPRGAWRREELLAEGAGPGDRDGAAYVYDPPRDRVVLYGGSEDLTTWELPLGTRPLTWHAITRPHISPDPGVQRFAHATYDPTHDRIVLVGAPTNDHTSTPAPPPGTADAWSLHFEEGTSWDRIVVRGSSPAVGGYDALNTAYDAKRARLLLLAPDMQGYGGSPFVWSLALDDRPAWTRVPVTGFIDSQWGFTTVVDAAHDRLILHGGGGGAYIEGGGPVSAAYALPLGGPFAWQPIADGLSRIYAAAVYDSAGQRMVTFGGSGAYAQAPFDGTHETWSLSLDAAPAWARVGDVEGPPAFRRDGVWAFDPSTDQAVLFGGWNGAYGLEAFAYNDLWTLRAGERGDAWTQLAPVRWDDPQAPAPSRRSDLFAAFDPQGHQVVAFGGRVEDAVYPPTWNGAAWRLALDGAPAWQPLVTQGVPPADRAGQTAVLDRRRHRLLVLGGLDPQGVRSDAWALDLSTLPPTWSSFPTTGDAPPLGLGARATYDASRDRAVVIVPGTDAQPALRAWTLTLGDTPRWDAVAAAAGEVPTPYAASITHDPVRDRELVLASHVGRSYDDPVTTETWALTWSDPPRWVRLSPTGAPRLTYGGSGVVYDPMRDRLIVPGMDQAEDQLDNQAWELALGNPTWDVTARVVSPAGAAADHGRRANDVDVALLSRPAWTSAFAPRPFDLAAIASLGVEGAPDVEVTIPPHVRAPRRDLDGDGNADLLVRVARRGTGPLPHPLVLVGTTTTGAAVRASVEPARPRDPPLAPADLVAAVAPEARWLRPGARPLTVVLAGASRPVTIDLFDVRGRRVRTRVVDPGAAGREFDLAAGERLAPGIYFARAREGDRSATVRLVVVTSAR